jgi:hypothetical protein
MAVLDAHIVALNARDERTNGASGQMAADKWGRVHIS